jgi:hypothetical protein
VTRTAPAVAFAAIHMGPYQTLVPVASLLNVRPVWAVDGIARRHREAEGAEFVDGARVADPDRAATFLRSHDVRAIVCGTSDDVDGVNVESSLAAAAAVARVPVAVVEDFPGNFHRAPASRLDALCVETEDTAALHAARGVPAPQVHVTGNPRYDALRMVQAPSRRANMRQALGVADEPLALWIGQPDADDSFATLEVVLPALHAAGTGLLFRAHPRDAGYAAGRYGALLAGAGLPVRDVTTEPDLTSLCCAADLVVTQFSSVAVEAGFLGTPALFVLLPAHGGAYIRKRKGYAIPPWCKENCAFLLDDAKMAAVVVDGAMHDSEAREAVRVNFARRYATRPPAASTVAGIITAFLER